MENPNKDLDTVQDDAVVSLEYSLKVDGETVDASEEDEPIQFIQGHGQIIAGLERELYGMQVGESKQVTVSAAEGYGEEDKEAFADVPRSEFPPNIPMQPGVTLQLRDEEGEILDAYIDSVEDQTVRLNFNHPLAGKELHFDVTVINVRPATDEELEHDHVHDYNDAEDEYEDWDEEDLEEDEDVEEESWEDDEEEDWYDEEDEEDLDWDEEDDLEDIDDRDY